MSCLTDEEVKRYIGDNLQGEERDRTQGHLESCKFCWGRVMAQVEINQAVVGGSGQRGFESWKMSPSCPDDLELYAYFSNETEQTRQGRIETHLKTCDLCVHRLRLLAMIEGSSARLAPKPVPEELRRAVLDMAKKPFRESLSSVPELIIRLVGKGLEVVRRELISTDISIQPLFAPAGISFRSGTEDDREVRALLITRAFPEKGIEIHLELRRESIRQVTLTATVFKDKQPCEGKRVSILRETVPFHSKKTREGTAEFASLPPGKYVLKLPDDQIEWTVELEDPQ